MHTQWSPRDTIELQRDPSGVLERGSANAGLLNLTILRLCKREVASLRLESKSVVMERYTGPKKVNPPLVVCRFGPPFTDVCALQGSLERAQIVDTQWLNPSCMVQTLSNGEAITLPWRECNVPLIHPLPTCSVL